MGDSSNSKSKRRVGVAVDFSPCSRKALRWALENLIRSDDELILITVLPQAYYETGEMQLWETTGSPLIPWSEVLDPHVMKKYEANPDPETLEIVSNASKQNGMSVFMRIFWGDPREMLCESVGKTSLDCLVLGNRGLGTLQRAIMGSVSNYVVNNGTCPVTVVKS
ncbi:universal stress protein PHOS32-like [Andrographis paniculata]|uniref:universal stress protein PHOS32-like n=1 Tax=Andrographis paniculata TaxID=175694 RepID=UPI0021E7CA6C|nr:universal stress protein PHOS32-like [Andrographis paniculata]